MVLDFFPGSRRSGAVVDREKEETRILSLALSSWTDSSYSVWSFHAFLLAIIFSFNSCWRTYYLATPKQQQNTLSGRFLSSPHIINNQSLIHCHLPSPSLDGRLKASQFFITLGGEEKKPRRQSTRLEYRSTTTQASAPPLKLLSRIRRRTSSESRRIIPTKNDLCIPPSVRILHHRRVRGRK